MPKTLSQLQPQELCRRRATGSKAPRRTPILSRQKSRRTPRPATQEIDFRCRLSHKDFSSGRVSVRGERLGRARERILAQVLFLECIAEGFSIGRSCACLRARSRLRTPEGQRERERVAILAQVSGNGGPAPRAPRGLSRTPTPFLRQDAPSPPVQDRMPQNHGGRTTLCAR